MDKTMNTYWAIKLHPERELQAEGKSSLGLGLIFKVYIQNVRIC